MEFKLSEFDLRVDEVTGVLRTVKLASELEEIFEFFGRIFLTGEARARNELVELLDGFLEYLPAKFELAKQVESLST